MNGDEPTLEQAAAFLEVKAEAATEATRAARATAVLDACAQAAHEANRAYCVALGDDSQVAWRDVPAWQRRSVMDGVSFALQGSTARELRSLARAIWKLGG